VSTRAVAAMDATIRELRIWPPGHFAVVAT
jgi:hypothetical protein